MQAKTTALVSAVAKSLPLSIDSIPDAVTDPNTDQDLTINLNPATMPYSDPFPDLNSNQNPNCEKCLKFSVNEESSPTTTTYERCTESNKIYLDKAVSGKCFFGKASKETRQNILGHALRVSDEVVLACRLC